MRPQLYVLLGQGFPAYFVLLLTGFIFATTMGALWARRIGHDPDVIIDLGLAMLLAGVVGSRLLHVVADGYFWDYVHLCTDPSKVDWRISPAECTSESWNGVWDAARGVCHPADRRCFAWAAFWAGGLTYYGGFLGASIAAWFLLKRDNFPFWKAADMAGFAIPVGLVFGRMGCLLAGCCFGVRSESALALVFPPRSPASDWQFKAGLLDSVTRPSLPVLPTQIFESAASLLIVAFCLLWLHPRKRYDGQVFVAFVALYAIARFVLEFFRSDDRGGLIGLSTSQLIGLGLVAGAYGVHRARARGMLSGLAASALPFEIVMPASARLVALAAALGSVFPWGCSSSDHKSSPPVSDCVDDCPVDPGAGQGVGGSSGAGGASGQAGASGSSGSSGASGASGAGGAAAGVMVTGTVGLVSDTAFNAATNYPDSALLTATPADPAKASFATWSGTLPFTLNGVATGDSWFWARPTAGPQTVLASAMRVHVDAKGLTGLQLLVVPTATITTILAQQPTPQTYDPNAGHVVLRLVDASGAPAKGATAKTNFPAYVTYDDGAMGYGAPKTGGKGTVLMLNASSVVDNSVTVSSSAGTETVVPVLIESQLVTFLTAVIAP